LGYDKQLHSFIYSLVIPQAVFNQLIADGNLSTSFGLGHDHNDLTGHPSYDAREEFITVTIQFSAELVPDDGATNTAPVAAFSISPANGTAPLKITLDASASSDNDGVIANYTWNIANLVNLTGKVVDYTFQEAGEYTIELTVTDSKGLSHSITKPLTVSEAANNQPPQAEFSVTPATGVVPLSVVFDATGSSDPEDEITSFSWNFGDGSSENGLVVSHQYTEVATYTVILTVTDGDNLKDIATQQVVVTGTPVPQPATAVITADRVTGEAPLSVAFSASQSSAELQLFYFGNEGETTFAWATAHDDWSSSTPTPPELGHFWTGATPLAVTSHAGNVSVSLDVTDFVSAELDSDLVASFEISNETVGWKSYGAAEGSASPLLIIDMITDGVSAENSPPVASFVSDKQQGPSPLLVTFDASNASDIDGTIVDYQWDFGDGGSATGVVVSHSFTAVGSYEISLIVTDNDAAQAKTKQTIIVNAAGNSAPKAVITSNKLVAELGETIQLSGSSSSDEDGHISAYSWVFGDGNTSVEISPEHAFLVAGTYTVELEVTDNEGASTTASIQIKITDPSESGNEVILPAIADVGATRIGNNASLTISEWNHAFIKFNVSQIDFEISKAILRLHNSSNLSVVTTVWPAISNDWTENSSVPEEIGYPWNSISELGNQAHATEGYIEWDITEYVQSNLNSANEMSFEVANDQPNWIGDYSARESLFPPQLILKGF
jgi:PKD repeat protein